MQIKHINPDNLQIMNATSAYKVSPYADKILSLLDPNSPNKGYFKPSEKNKVLFFDDEEELSNLYKLPNLMHIHMALEFVDNISPNDKVIIHCEAGRSRSTAMAIGCLIYSGMKVREAVEKVFELRPKAIPNNLIIRLFEQELNLETNQIRSIVEEHYNKNDVHYN